MESTLKNEKRLLGKWTSDAERTIASFSKSQLEQFGSIFGKMKFEYTEDTIVSELDGVFETVGYSVLDVDSHFVLIRVHAPIEEVDSTAVGGPYDARIFFEGEQVYYTEIPYLGIKEYFSRCS